MKIAAIDCGTNSFHLLVARVGTDGVIEPLDRAKEMVRLGDSAFKGVISEEATTRAIEAIRRFRGIAERGGVDAVIAVATSAVREAENGGDFVRIVRDETGIELTVIRGDEEARLIFLGARAQLSLGASRALVVDIGGGSVELIVGDSREVHHTASLKLGVLRLLDTFTLSDPVTPDQRAKLAEHLHRVLESAMVPVSKVGFDVLAMTSGTARQVAELVPAAVDSKDKLRRVAFKDIYQLEDRLCLLHSSERAKIPGLDPRRIDSIVPGVILVRALLETAHADQYVMCDTALREGLVADYAARNRPSITLVDEFPDPRRRSIVGLMRRCNANVAHAQHVARLALDLFRGTRPLHNLSNSDGELLEFAALLHDIGFHVASSKHHKHAAYLIENAELKGFSPDEISVLAQVARYHRKATPKEAHEGFARLPAQSREKVRMLAALLRVADGLDRGYAQVVRSVRVRTPDKSDKSVDVTLSANGEPELEVWGARRKADLFQEVFAKKLKFSVEEQKGAPTV
jgi:exopolyphosphatase/guanosine-5'-triphosphate,3'-diphosphate pyrophosphatase